MIQSADPIFYNKSEKGGIRHVKKIMKTAGLLTATALPAGIYAAWKKLQKTISDLPGNGEPYDFSYIQETESPLKGKKIAVLGSSVAHGAFSMQKSLGEYFALRFGADLYKETVSGTTLADVTPLSYVRRIRKLDRNAPYDVFICQLSTNDATTKRPLGEIGSDTKTVTGAIEYIIRHARDHYHCPVVFFTGSRYESEAYEAMVERLMEIKKLYGIGVIDLWHDEDFNNISDKDRALYMHDPIHPTKAGYRDWWGPEAERQLLAYLQEQEGTSQKQES